MVTCLRWILGYMRLEILHISLLDLGLHEARDFAHIWTLMSLQSTVLCTRSGACY